MRTNSASPTAWIRSAAASSHLAVGAEPVAVLQFRRRSSQARCASTGSEVSSAIRASIQASPGIKSSGLSSGRLHGVGSERSSASRRSTITVRELIRSRVFEEVKVYNERQSGVFQGLVQPEGSEWSQGGFRIQDRRRLDWHEQAEAALQAFTRNGFVLLVDHRQVESLDEEIRIRPETRVTFLKLVPLVGG